MKKKKLQSLDDTSQLVDFKKYSQLIMFGDDETRGKTKDGIPLDFSIPQHKIFNLDYHCNMCQSMYQMHCIQLKWVLDYS